MRICRKNGRHVNFLWGLVLFGCGTGPAGVWRISLSVENETLTPPPLVQLFHIKFTFKISRLGRQLLHQQAGLLGAHRDHQFHVQVVRQLCRLPRLPIGRGPRVFIHGKFAMVYERLDASRANRTQKLSFSSTGVEIRSEQGRASAMRFTSVPILTRKSSITMPFQKYLSERFCPRYRWHGGCPGRLDEPRPARKTPRTVYLSKL